MKEQTLNLNGKIRAAIQVTTKSVAHPNPGGANPKQPVLEFISSTAMVDRYQEVIEPAGWQLETYRRNPVFQNAHQYGDVLFTLGKALITEIREVNGEAALFQRIEFATEVNPIARIAFGLYQGGFLRAVSVGFIPLRWEDASPEESVRRGDTVPRRRYLEQELLEVSAVAIPANPEALALGVKSGAVHKCDLADSIELLRRLAAGLGDTGPLTGNLENTLNFARELRRILHCT